MLLRAHQIAAESRDGGGRCSGNKHCCRSRTLAMRRKYAVTCYKTGLRQPVLTRVMRHPLSPSPRGIPLIFRPPPPPPRSSMFRPAPGGGEKMWKSGKLVSTTVVELRSCIAWGGDVVCRTDVQGTGFLGGLQTYHPVSHLCFFAFVPTTST